MIFAICLMFLLIYLSYLCTDILFLFMYEQEGLQNSIYLLLYGATAMLAVVSCLYLLMRRYNMFSISEPPVRLRRWAAAFLAADALSHIWWIVIGTVVIVDDRLVRNAVNIGLDSVTLVPLMMVTLICMLQDKRRKLWPIGVATIPVVVAVAWGIAGHHTVYEDFVRNYLIAISIFFIAYMVFCVLQYGKWLRDNYADLEHKEVWQSLVLLVAILLTFVCYKTNFGGFMSEYAVQLMTIVLISFLLWRVETLQLLEPADDHNNENTPDEEGQSVCVPSYINTLLAEHCEANELYLQHDLTIGTLCAATGTNRTYLSGLFSQQGINYNTYINQLRIQHFMRLYRETIANESPYTTQELALKSGFRSYRTFSTSFKQLMGMTPTEWMKKQ
ncbi:AraC-type DNA-binding protein [Prevotella sp. tc2-28]|nr:AraC-type DNA-binding protein [Prevotella sp. tc2-28]